MNYSAIEIRDDNFQDFVLESKVPFLLLISSAWNIHQVGQPCHALCEFYESLSDQWIGKMLWGVGDIDLLNGDMLISKYRIRSIPTTLLFRNGQVEHRVVGFMRKSDWVKLLSPYLV